jgi:GTP pyrophosphokinase
VKSGGPSRDWLSPKRAFLRSHRARSKVRQWFNAQALAKTVAAGRRLLEKELRREGAAQANLEDLARRLDLARIEELFAAVARDEVNLRQLQRVLREMAGAPQAPAAAPRRRAAGATGGGVLVVGMDRLLTQLAKCCKPVPPDTIRGFVTRGKGVSIHREECPSLKRLAEAHGERLIETQWGANAAGAYAVEISVTASDRQGLLRDIGDALARERINVTAVRTQSRDDVARMRFSFEVGDLPQLRRALAAVKGVRGVIRVARG